MLHRPRRLFPPASGPRAGRYGFDRYVQRTIRNLRRTGECGGRTARVVAVARAVDEVRHAFRRLAG